MERESQAAAAGRLNRRVSVGIAKKMIGCSDDHVRSLIEAEELDGIDVRRPGARRACWSITIASIERFIRRRKKKPTEPLECMPAADRAAGVSES